MLVITEKKNTEKLVKYLSTFEDVIILSGLAYGIDICAHNAALKYKIPTIAVVAHGFKPNISKNTLRHSEKYDQSKWEYHLRVYE